MIKAKPLIWEEDEQCAMGYRENSHAPWGMYWVEDHENSGEWRAYFDGLNGDDILGAGDDQKEVVSICQAHADQLVADMAQPVTPQEAARVLLEAIDAFMGGDKLTEAQSELQKSTFCAGCFAAAAYDAHIPKSGGEYHTLTRSFLLALIDPTHEDLDYLRADPSSGSAARKASDALRDMAAPPQENALQELADLGQEFDAAPQEKDDE